MGHKLLMRKSLLLMIVALGFVAAPSLAELKAPAFDRQSTAKLSSGNLPMKEDGFRAVAVMIDLWVDPKGKIFKCSASHVAGDPKRIDQICPSYEQIPLSPATDVDGKPVFGRLITMFKILGDGYSRAQEVRNAQLIPDVEIILNKLPEGADRSYNLSLVIAVDELGNVASCNGSAEIAEILKKIVCSRIKDGNFGIVRSEDGSAVPYVTNLSAKFSAKTE